MVATTLLQLSIGMGTSKLNQSKANNFCNDDIINVVNIDLHGSRDKNGYYTSVLIIMTLHTYSSIPVVGGGDGDNLDACTRQSCLPDFQTVVRFNCIKTILRIQSLWRIPMTKLEFI